MTRRDIMDYYKTFSCVITADDTTDFKNCATFNIPVLASDSEKTLLYNNSIGQLAESIGNFLPGGTFSRLPSIIFKPIVAILDKNQSAVYAII